MDLFRDIAAGIHQDDLQGELDLELLRPSCRSGSVLIHNAHFSPFNHFSADKIKLVLTFCLYY